MFGQPEDPTTDDLVEAASLIQVIRWTEIQGIGLVRSCFDDETGGPLAFLVESGRFDFVVAEPGPGVAGIPAVGVPTLFRADDREASLVVPGSRIELSPGDIVLTPNGTQCSLLSPSGGADAPVVLLLVRFFPSGPFLLRNDAFTTIENYDVNFGMATVNPPPPSVIVSGVLTLQAGAELSISQLTPVAALSVRSGTLDVVVNSVAGILRRQEAGGIGSSSPIPPRTGVTVNRGESLYLPPGSDALLRNPGQVPVSLLMVSISPSLWQPS